MDRVERETKFRLDVLEETVAWIARALPTIAGRQELEKHLQTEFGHRADMGQALQSLLRKIRDERS